VQPNVITHARSKKRNERYQFALSRHARMNTRKKRLKLVASTIFNPLLIIAVRRAGILFAARHVVLPRSCWLHDNVGRVLGSSPAKSSTMDIIPTSLVLRCKAVFL